MGDADAAEPRPYNGANASPTLADVAQYYYQEDLRTDLADELPPVAGDDAKGVLPNAIGVRPASGVSAEQLATRINDAAGDADALTRKQAAEETPGVAQVRQSFQVIFLLYALVVPLVTGLFFLIITFQKSASLVLLRAIGIRSGTLVRSLLGQVVIVMAGGVSVAVMVENCTHDGCFLGTAAYLRAATISAG